MDENQRDAHFANMCTDFSVNACTILTKNQDLGNTLCYIVHVTTYQMKMPRL
jgi:hypothetical protein